MFGENFLNKLDQIRKKQVTIETFFDFSVGFSVNLFDLSYAYESPPPYLGGL